MNNTQNLLLLLIFTIFSIGYTRSFEPIRGKHGMVVTEDPVASLIGIEILKAGGNAFDAAIAVGFAMAVSYPQAGNIGGGGFMLLFKSGKPLQALDYREKAPLKAHKNMYLDPDNEIIPDASTLGYLSSGVPGTVHGLWQVYSSHASMEWQELLKPAIKLADEGYLLDQYSANTLNAYHNDFRKFQSTSKIFIKHDREYEEGDLFIQKDLAATLRRISENGPDDFYNGTTASIIASEMKKNGGLISEADLRQYHSVWREPVEIRYRDYLIYSMPPPSSGGLVLAEIFNCLENFNLTEIGQNSSDIIRLWTEIERYAFFDRAMWMGDPDYFKIPVETFLSKDYAKKICNRINYYSADTSLKLEAAGSLIDESLQTTHFSIIDKWGNAVSNTYTLNSGFGSKVVIEGTGILMNNEMDDFSIKSGYPNQFGLVGRQANAIEPGKRMLSSMSPSIIMRNNSLYMVIGSPGGSRIISTVAQVISNVIDHGLNIRDAIERPRIHHQWKPDVVFMEDGGFSLDVIRNLQGRGYKLQPSSSIGSAQAILRDFESGELYGWSDPRNNGTVETY